MQDKTFKYDRCDKNESVITGVFFKYSGAIEINVSRDDDYIYVKLSGAEELQIEAIKDLMANICYVVDL